MLSFGIDLRIAAGRLGRSGGGRCPALSACVYSTGGSGQGPALHRMLPGAEAAGLGEQPCFHQPGIAGQAKAR